jgi:hypothetical protein
MEMQIGLQSDLSDASWQAYASSPTLSLESDPDTVYVQFRDNYGNTTSIQEVTTPETPQNVSVEDVSNIEVSPEEYKLFLSWQAIEPSLPEFDQYIIYRSSDAGTTWNQHATVSSRGVNYYLDDGLNQYDTFHYKLVAQDQDGNISYESQVVSEEANGVDGDAHEPVISNVEIVDKTTTSITIAWHTDELSDSQVDYLPAPDTDFSSAPYIGRATMLDNPDGAGRHLVTVSGLTSDEHYNFRLHSTDAAGNEATYILGSSEKTLDGAEISNVSVDHYTETQATITWNTNINADTHLHYSTQPDMSSASTESKPEDATQSHSVTLTGLTPDTKYFFWAESGDAKDKNVVDGQEQYYSFTTSTPQLQSLTTTTSEPMDRQALSTSPLLTRKS